MYILLYKLRKSQYLTFKKMFLFVIAVYKMNTNYGNFYQKCLLYEKICYTNLVKRLIYFIRKVKIYMEEKRNLVVKTIKLTAEQHEKIAEIASRTNRTFNSVFNELLEYGLDNLEDKE